MSERTFTVAEAQALLPTVRRTFQELAELGTEMEKRMDRIKILDALWGDRIHDPDNPDREEFVADRAGVRRTVERIEALVEERFMAQGIRFPPGGLEHGLVDFPTKLDGRIVYLCWQMGEERIQAWHEVDGGFAGRRALTDDVARRMGPDDPAR